MNLTRLIILGLFAGFLAGCSNNTIPDPDPEGTYGGASDSDASTGGAGDGGFGSGEDIPFDPDPELATVIYFEYDSSDISPEDADSIAAHARQLVGSSGLSVRLEGHADERGSREYNIGLGERRAQAVRRILLLQGASTEQVSTVSFGEERPAAFGSDESAYAQNRRVEIRYTQ